MRSLKPPAEISPDGVTYRPVPPRRLGGLWLLMAAVSALATAGNGYGVPLTTGLFGASTVLWLLAAAADARRGEVTVGLHRLAVREWQLGLRRLRLHLPWEEVRGARIDGDHLTVLHTDGRLVRTAVRGTPGQLAWIVGHITERVGAAQLTDAEASQLEARRLELLALVRGSQGATVTETP